MALKHLPDHAAPVFSTFNFAQAWGLSQSSASHRLARLERSGLVQRLTKGVWFQPRSEYLSKYSAAPLLLGKEQGYVSFLSALNLHDVIDQIPESVMIATTGYSRVVSTPLGMYELFRLKPAMMTEGFGWSETHQPYLLAEPERALLDTFYIATRKGNRFASLPEIDWSRIDRQRLTRLIDSQVFYARIRTAIMRRVP